MENNPTQFPAVEEFSDVSADERSGAGKTQLSDSGWVTARLLWQHRSFLGHIILRTAIIATIIAVLIPNRYTSTTRIMPPENSQNGMAMLAAIASRGAPGLAALAGDFAGGKNSGALFVGLLRSRTIADRLIARFDLRKIYSDRYWEDARKRLHSRTDISEDRKSGIITISVTDKDRRRAADLANAYVEELDRLVAQVSTSSARQERIFIEQRLAGVKVDLDQAEKAFSEFASKNTALDIKEQTKTMVASAAQLQGELIAAQAEMQALQQIYTSNNVRVRSLAARISGLQQELAKLQGTDAAIGTTKQDDAYPSIRKLPLLGVQWANLYRESKVQETVYELLTQRYEMARIEEAKEIPVVKVADRGEQPEKKSFPPRALIILFSAALGGVAASVWVTYSYRWQQMNGDDPRKVLLTEIWDQAQSPIKTLRQWPNRNGHTKMPTVRGVPGSRNGE